MRIKCQKVSMYFENDGTRTISPRVLRRPSDGVVTARPGQVASILEVPARRPATPYKFFGIFLSLSREMTGMYFLLGHDRFLPHSFQFMPSSHSIIRRPLARTT
jgi:hypothetical protein